MRPKVLILRTAGTNCDYETEFAFKIAGADTYRLHLNVVKKECRLMEFQLICIPGGFSYGDDLGAGKIFSLELLLWFKEELKKFLYGGGLIIGICNGFQVLTKTGILPDLDFSQKVTLTLNDSQRFEDRWVYLKINDKNLSAKKIWFKDLPDIIMLPVAHAEGKFFTSSQTLKMIEDNNLVILRYVDERGNLSGYPYNPNGSLNNIAGITDTSGKVLGLMPHPERFIFIHHHPFWCKEQIFPFGLKIFQNAIDYLKQAEDFKDAQKVNL